MSDEAHGHHSVASAIRELRLRLGETQVQFAVRNGLAVSTLARYEAGAQRPKPAVLKMLCVVAENFPDLAHALNQEIEKGAKDRSRVRVVYTQGTPVQDAGFQSQLQRFLEHLDRMSNVVRSMMDESASTKSSAHTVRDELSHNNKHKTAPRTARAR